MTIIEITHSNINYFYNFLQNDFPTTFRYFNNKTAEQVLRNHYKTILYLYNDIPVGYAHIDYDNINNKYWFGLCVISKYQNMGIGTKLIKEIINYLNNSTIDILYLTVDKSNIVAYNMYLKHGFKIQRETDIIYIMMLNKTNLLYLPVSYGEAIDKLTILDIKMNKITDERKKDVTIEFNKLASELKELIKPINFYYEALKMINLSIWEDQDIFRYSSNEYEKSKICIKIINENDARFRIKNKINLTLNSYLKEQKGYNEKIIKFNYTNDTNKINFYNSIIKYESIFNDKVIVYCSSLYIDSLKKYFIYDPSIEININGASSIYINELEEEKYNNNKIFDLVKYYT